ncbi:MAG TPA: hypothetical protein VJO12_16470 [Stellaceae bacterium]|nr:hypothetical protein [Stellaceae bacterium]
MHGHGIVALLSAACATIALAGAANAMDMQTDEQLIQALSTAAPQHVVEHATILNMRDGKMQAVREGNNGWTCMDPGGAPMCADKAAMEWAQAWQSHAAAPQKLGFIYMLNGDTGASNTDPYAKGESADNNWVRTGAHVMIVGAEAKPMMDGYPREAKADPNTPYVMWPGTPYEHLMLPVATQGTPSVGSSVPTPSTAPATK